MSGPTRFADDASRYRLHDLIATGGMGEVWHATDTLLDRPVAVKLLRSEYAEDEEFRGRFQTEARHAAALHDPHVAAVFDFGEAGSRPFLVMELVPGQPLSALLRGGRPMAPAVVRDLVGQAASGLAVAHARGIVHRDIKPANLLVTPEGRLKVTDFGIARAADSVAVTQPGTVIGTAFYLSPEQARGETAGPAADVYALGVVAYECLTGRRPFAGDTPVGTALALRDPIPDLPPTVPADLAAVVLRALAKTPADRFPDAGALAAALAATGRGQPATAVSPVLPAPPTQVLAATSATRRLPPTPAYAPASPTAPWWRHRWVAAGVAAAVVLVVALLAAALSQDPAPDERAAQRSAADPSAQAAPTRVQVSAADYVGDPVAQAERELRQRGLDVTLVTTANPGDRPAGTVEDVAPTGSLPPGATVTVASWGPAPAPTDTSQGDPGKSKGTSNTKGKGKK